MAAEKKAGGRPDNATSGPSSFWARLQLFGHLMRHLFEDGHGGASTGWLLELPFGGGVHLVWVQVACSCGRVFWEAKDDD